MLRNLLSIYEGRQAAKSSTNVLSVLFRSEEHAGVPARRQLSEGFGSEEFSTVMSGRYDSRSPYSHTWKSYRPRGTANIIYQTKHAGVSQTFSRNVALFAFC